MSEINWKDKCWMTVIYLINEDNKVLLHWNKNMNTWIPIGGHINLGENPQEAIKREVAEETGFEFEFLDKNVIQGNSEIIDFYRFQIDKVPHHNQHMTFVFIGNCKKYQDKEGTDENEKIQWFSEEEIKNMKDELIESVYIMCLDAIKLVKIKNQGNSQ